MNSRNDIQEIIQILNKRKKLLFYPVIILTILTVLITLFMPLTYRSTAVILPPTGENVSGFMGMLGGLPLGQFGLSATDEEAYLYLAILKSRTVLERIVEKYQLQEEWNSRYLEDAVKILSNSTEINIEDEGTITISMDFSTTWFPDKEEKRRVSNFAANIANTYVTILDSTNRRLKMNQARIYRDLIEKRYEKNLTDLKIVEHNLRNFQEKYGIISLEHQTKASIEMAANLQAQIITMELEYRALKNSMTKSSPAVMNLEIKIRELKSTLQKIEGKDNLKISDSDNIVFPQLTKLPELGIEYLRLYREMEVQNQLYEFLTKKYEEAKIQESKDSPTVQILDVAIPFERKYKPKRSLIVLTVFMLTGLFSMILIFILEKNKFSIKNQ